MNKIVKELLKIPVIAQKSASWYEARHTMVSASDIAMSIGKGKFGTQKEFIIKKVEMPDHGTLNNPFFQHGNDFEQVACDVYTKMHNVKLYHFGLLKHPTVSYIGASPDAIRNDGIMLEIKCPYKRKIKMGDEVPEQYFLQIQGQLDVCNLDECDYFECEFAYCKSIWEFEASTKTRGVFIKNPDDTITYGPLVLKDTDESMDEIEKFIEKNKGKKIQYWVLNVYNLKRVKRDKKLIKNVIIEVGKVWEKILYYRENRAAFETEILCSINIETEPANITIKKNKSQDINTNENKEIKLDTWAFID